MQLHEILELGPILYAVPVGDVKFGEVFNIVGEKIYRYSYTFGEYTRSGVKVTFVDFDSNNLDALVEQAEEFWKDIMEDDNGR
jgi:hypothetical protein